jgi:hypothetical protein
MAGPRESRAGWRRRIARWCLPQAVPVKVQAPKRETHPCRRSCHRSDWRRPDRCPGGRGAAPGYAAPHPGARARRTSRHAGHADIVREPVTTTWPKATRHGGTAITTRLSRRRSNPAADDPSPARLHCLGQGRDGDPDESQRQRNGPWRLHQVGAGPFAGDLEQHPPGHVLDDLVAEIGAGGCLGDPHEGCYRTDLSGDQLTGRLPVEVHAGRGELLQEHIDFAVGPRTPGHVASLPSSRHGARLHPNGRWR